MPVPYRHRAEAGRFLAEKLAGYTRDPDLLVLAPPRGGVPVAYEVARALGAPLDVFLVRKLGGPGHEELAMGASPPVACVSLKDISAPIWAVPYRGDRGGGAAGARVKGRTPGVVGSGFHDSGDGSRIRPCPEGATVR